MPIRLVAKVGAHPGEPRVKHYVGLPPQATSGKDHRTLMEAPVVVAIEEKPDGIFLFRFMGDGQIVGDTWHMTVEEAKQQANFEFGEFLSEWRSVPTGIEDLLSFGLKG